MKSILISDTTREEREKIVAESIGKIDAACDGCSPGLVEMYQDYIDGRRELREINMEFNARYVSGATGPERGGCPRADDAKVALWDAKVALWDAKVALRDAKVALRDPPPRGCRGGRRRAFRRAVRKNPAWGVPARGKFAPCCRLGAAAAQLCPADGKFRALWRDRARFPAAPPPRSNF